MGVNQGLGADVRSEPLYDGAGQASRTDALVGGCLNRRRTALGRSVEEAAEVLGVRPAEVMLIEAGLWRLNARDLFTLSRWLDMRVADFFAQ